MFRYHLALLQSSGLNRRKHPKEHSRAYLRAYARAYYPDLAVSKQALRPGKSEWECVWGGGEVAQKRRPHPELGLPT